jgi:hypothetical protein
VRLVTKLSAKVARYQTATGEIPVLPLSKGIPVVSCRVEQVASRTQNIVSDIDYQRPAPTGAQLFIRFATEERSVSAERIASMPSRFGDARVRPCCYGLLVQTMRNPNHRGPHHLFEMLPVRDVMAVVNGCIGRETSGSADKGSTAH